MPNQVIRPAIPDNDDKTKNKALPGMKDVKKQTSDTALVQINE